MAVVESTDEELRMLYQVTVSDLAYFKTQQWSVTNYAFALIAGIIGVSQFIKPLGVCDRIVLVVLAIIVIISSVVMLFKLQRSIKVRQSRLAAARGSFSESFQQVWAAETKGQEYLHSIYFLYGALVIGASLAVWLIGFRL
ncbi:MAG: hypothetical protein ABL880_03855 [Methylotenera sp.]